MQNCANRCGKPLKVRISAENGQKCGKVRRMSRSAIPHRPHLNGAPGGKRYLMTFVQINIQYYLWLISPASIRRVAHSLTLLGELSTKNNIKNLALRRKTINWLSEVHAFQCLYDRRFTLSVMKHIISWILWIAILKPQGLRQTGSSLHYTSASEMAKVE